jgi:Fe-S-cluster-containing hydrogenase component 2
MCPNDAIRMDAEGIADVNHDRCITCGYCAPVCPYRAILLY